MPRTIFVVHPGGLGDVLLARPALRVVQAAFPSHQLGLVAGAEVGRLLHACGEVAAAFPLESGALAGLLAGPAWVASTLRDWLVRCDLAVCWMADPESRLSSTLQGLGVSRVIVRSPASSAGVGMHQEDRFLETVRDIVTAERVEQRLQLPDHLRARGRARLAMIHPGSGSPRKCVAPALLAALVARLQAIEVVPVLIGGPADDGMVADVVDACARPPVIVRDQDLLAVAGQMAHADLFVGHDSGLTHLATALQVPTVALFGPTDPRRWAPRGPHVTVLTGEPCGCDGWSAVQVCSDQSCLRIPEETLTMVCERLLRRAREVIARQTEATPLPCDAPEVMLD